MGKLLEPLVLAEYERRTGRAVEAAQLFVRDPEHPFLTATLDGVCADGRIVEAKTAGAWAKEWGDEGTDEVPDNYVIQCQHQMLVTGADAVDLAVLIGGQRFRLFEVKRNEDLIGVVLGRCLEFWRCVASKTPPDWGRVTAAGLLALNPGCEGEVDLGDEVRLFVAMYEEAIAFMKDSEAVADAAKLRVLQALGNAQIGRLGDGRVVKRFVQEVAESTRTTTVKAHTRHYFRISKGKS